MTDNAGAAGGGAASGAAAGDGSPGDGIDRAPIKANWHINGTQGIVIPESLSPKGEDGKPLPPAPDPSVDIRISMWRSYGVGEDVLAQVREGKPVSAQEYELAQHKRTALMSDRAWVGKYLDGDVKARRQMALVSIILGSKIGESKNG
jgi:hypothetical protein